MTTADFSVQSVQDVRLLGNVSVNLDTYQVHVGDAFVETTYLELELLRLLMAQPNRIVSYTDLTEALLHASDRGAIRHLNVLVHRLRSKLAGSEPYTIETVRGRGYGLLRSPF